MIEIKVGEGKDYKTEEEFWYERSTYKFLGNYEGIYQRVQGRNDHALGYQYPHAIAYLNTATKGKAKWTRLNKAPKSLIYKSIEQPDGVPIEQYLDIENVSSNRQIERDLLYQLIEEAQK